MMKIIMAFIMIFNYGISITNAAAPYAGSVKCICDDEYWEIDFYYKENTNSGYIHVKEYIHSEVVYEDAAEIENNMSYTMFDLIESLYADNEITIIGNTISFAITFS